MGVQPHLPVDPDPLPGPGEGLSPPGLTA